MDTRRVTRSMTRALKAKDARKNITKVTRGTQVTRPPSPLPSPTPSPVPSMLDKIPEPFHSFIVKHELEDIVQAHTKTNDGSEEQCFFQNEEYGTQILIDVKRNGHYETWTARMYHGNNDDPVTYTDTAPSEIYKFTSTMGTLVFSSKRKDRFLDVLGPMLCWLADRE